MSDTAQSTSDKSKYIRTYAKDVAALTGGQPKARVPQPNIPPPASPSPSPQLQMPRATEAVARTYNTPIAPTDPVREATLARLKEKMEENARMQIETRSPTPPPPQPTFVEPPAEPLAPIPAVAQEQPSPIHTYKSDFADRIDEKQASTFSVLAAQGDAPKSTPMVQKKDNRVAIIGAVVLIALGGAGLGGAAWYVMRSNMVPGAPLSAPSLFFADEQIRLTASGNDLMSEIAALANEPLPEGNVVVLYLSEATTTAKGGTVEVPLSGGTLISAMQLPAPDILLRNISQESTVGIIHAGEETRPFFVLKVRSYERTFAGMLAWETSMARDLTVLYPARGAGQLNPAGSSVPLASSSPPVTEAVRTNPTFEDAIVANHDVRVLRDTTGRSLMLYGYAKKDLLIIARDEAAYMGLISRLSAGE